MEMDVFDKVFNGMGAEEDGCRTLEMGVKEIDVVVGQGTLVRHKSLVTCSYKLTVGSCNAVIDSSK